MSRIAFLLLFFFLVTNCIREQGLKTQLLLWQDSGNPEIIEGPNLLKVLLYQSDELSINSKKIEIGHLREEVLRFIDNEEEDALDSKSSEKIHILLSVNASVSYDFYLLVYNELQAAYRQIWEREAQHRYAKNWENLTHIEQQLIKKTYPMRIVEQELSKNQ